MERAAFFFCRWLGPAIALTLTACSDEPPPTLASASAPVISAMPVEPPQPQASAKTESPSISLGNVDAQIRDAEAKLKKEPTDHGAKTKLVGLRLMRFGILGKSEDLSRSVEIAEAEASGEHPTADALILRAKARAAVHRFQLALADLDAADKLDPVGAPSKTGPRRVSILVATGHYEEAMPLLERATRTSSEMGAFADMAATYGAMGQYEQAESYFVQAEQRFRSVSSFSLVQLYFDRASMWQEAGNLASATTLLKAAHTRLPQHVHVAVHLAQLLPPSEAIAMLTPFVDTSDDPDVLAQLGVFENLVKEHAGDAHLAQAAQRYEALYAQFPEAYADHAGWFWATAGDDPPRALVAAKLNLSIRQTAAAYELLIAAAQAAKDDAALCAARPGATALKYSTPRLKSRLAEIADKSCPEAPAGPPSAVPSASSGSAAAPSVRSATPRVGASAKP